MWIWKNILCFRTGGGDRARGLCSFFAFSVVSRLPRAPVATSFSHSRSQTDGASSGCKSELIGSISIGAYCLLLTTLIRAHPLHHMFGLHCLSMEVSLGRQALLCSVISFNIHSTHQTHHAEISVKGTVAWMCQSEEQRCHNCWFSEMLLCYSILY